MELDPSRIDLSLDSRAITFENPTGERGAGGWAQKRVENLSVLEGSQGFSVKVEVEPAAVVAGTLRDPGGQPLGEVGVWVLDAAGVPRSQFSEVSSDAGGGYEVGDLQDGAWSLAFMGSGHALTIA